MWLSLATTFALEAEVTSQDDRATPNAGIEVAQQKSISELAISGYACNPDVLDYYPGQSVNFLGSSGDQLRFEDFAPYWADYP